MIPRGNRDKMARAAAIVAMPTFAAPQQPSALDMFGEQVEGLIDKVFLQVTQDNPYASVNETTNTALGVAGAMLVTDPVLTRRPLDSSIAASRPLFPGQNIERRNKKTRS